jgi:hypothetical protein
MRTRRRLVALAIAVVALAVAGSAAAPASGGPPGTGCPPGFQLEPESILGEGFVGKVVDVNNDDLICIRFLTGGNIPEGAFVFIDNVVP